VRGNAVVAVRTGGTGHKIAHKSDDNCIDEANAKAAARRKKKARCNKGGECMRKTT
jgi:hypothetical protein